MSLTATGVTEQLRWPLGSAELVLDIAADRPVAVVGLVTRGTVHPLYALPAIEVLTARHGHRPASDRLVHTSLGEQLRYLGHEEHAIAGGRRLVVRVGTPDLAAEWHLESFGDAAAVRSTVRVSNLGPQPVVLRSVASWAAGFTPAAASADPFAGWTLADGRSDWLGENRWQRRPLRGSHPRLAEHLTGHNPRSSLARTSTGTWSTGSRLPVGVVESVAAGLAWGWQIEHNGAWRWEVGEDTRGGYLALSGPTETDAAWTRELGPGEEFTTIPVAIAIGTGFDDVLAELTAYRRLTRRDHDDNRQLPVVFNDYMNTLNGDPTTERLLPLVAAAAEVGAEIFCIDAGWYDDSGHWWDTVGEWLPSTTRFPGGLDEVVDAIRAAGMVPGLWLEPEVVGVRSPVAERLPDEAFLQRRGQRIVEHDRYHLDLRHPVAIAHLDGVVDSLVARFGIGFFKFDYNIDPGAGTDHDAQSLGDGLLEHNRAHLRWLDAVLDRHPGLVIENCGSGGMRSDFAMLSRLAMQSTSDQQDFTRFPPIAASAPLLMLPEQAASWAYPQPGMTQEEAAFCLVTGMLGRYYLSGYLNEMTDAERELVADAVRVARSLRPVLRSATPTWPLGLPEWDAPWISLALRTADETLVAVWRRGGDNASAELRFPHLAGSPVEVEPVFPVDLPGWDTTWDAAEGVLRVRSDDAPVAARTFLLRPVVA